MSKQCIQRTELLQSFSELARQFNSSLQDAQALENNFDASRSKLTTAISGHLHSAQKSLPKTNPLQEQLRNFSATIEQISREWDSKVAGLRKGVQFRQGFEDSLLVFVSGKVKSGKSSLGNFMAWGHTDPTDEIRCQTPPQFQPKYQSHARVDVEGGDSHHEAENRREFRVGATEATSSIQSFTLPGLTWVDSPGLHSLKKENGNLAREYLDHADLILYTVKSDAPGRASDLAEVSELIRKDKKTLLLLTGSDDMIEDEDEHGNENNTFVMKDAERCAKQCNSVRSEIYKLPNIDSSYINQLEILSVSSRYAQENSNTPSAFLDSGMGAFCTTLHDICQSEGIAIKQHVPMANLRNFLNDCEKDLGPYQKLIDAFRLTLREQDDKLQQQIPPHVREGQQQLRRYIDKFFSALEKRRDDGNYINTQLKDFNGKVGKEFQKIAETQLRMILEELISDFQSNIKDTCQHSLLAEIPDFKLDTMTETIAVGTQSGTKKRNRGIGALVGGGLGLFFGPAGVAVGSLVGGMAGGASGDSASIIYKDIDITVGDNLQDIRRKLIDSHCEALETQLESNTMTLWSESRTNMEKLLKSISVEMDQFHAELKAILQKTTPTFQ